MSENQEEKFDNEEEKFDNVQEEEEEFENANIKLGEEKFDNQEEEKFDNQEEEKFDNQQEEEVFDNQQEEEVFDNAGGNNGEEKFDNVEEEFENGNQEEEEFENATALKQEEKKEPEKKEETTVSIPFPKKFSEIPNFVNNKHFLTMVKKSWDEITSKYGDDFYKGKCTHANARKNQEKNRYEDILPVDNYRVVLTKDGDDENSDYINASRIGKDILAPFNEYISAQAPLEDTLEDFYRMIWEEKIQVIVAVVKEIERGMIKTHRYWPEKKLEKVICGDFVVSFINAEQWRLVENGNIIRFLQIEREGEKRPLIQIHYNHWPDRGIPETSGEFELLLKTTEHYLKELKVESPLLVHCSAGVGRTGVFLLAYHQIHRLRFERAKNPNADPDFDMMQAIAEMRERRMSMVQTLDQYEFVWKIMATMVEKEINSPNPQPEEPKQVSKTSDKDAAQSLFESQIVSTKDATPSLAESQTVSESSSEASTIKSDGSQSLASSLSTSEQTKITKDDTSPTKEETPPTKEEIKPAKEEIKEVKKEETSPTKEEIKPTKEESKEVKKEESKTTGKEELKEVKKEESKPTGKEVKETKTTHEKSERKEIKLPSISSETPKERSITHPIDKKQEQQHSQKTPVQQSHGCCLI